MIKKLLGTMFLSIYNLKGQLVKSLVNENKPAGYHAVEWLAENRRNRQNVVAKMICKYPFGNYLKAEN